MSRTKLYISSTFFLIVLSILLFFFYIPKQQDAKRNTVIIQDIASNTATLEFHQSLFIADLHADSLLWDRNLKLKHKRGHVDIPRLLEGNIGLQIFSVVTKSPKNQNLFNNSDETDNITLLVIAQRWPIRTWASLYQRAVYQSEKLHRLQNKSESEFYIIKSKQDFSDYLKIRSTNANIIAGLLSLEGAHALEGKLENVKGLYDAGYRIIGFTHFFDNQLGGSAHGIKKAGITNFGLQVLRQMEKLGIFVDLSHSSPSLINDIAKHSTRPLIATHTGVKKICGNSPRNLSDNQIKLIAESKGVIGIGFWPNATCSNDILGIVKSIRHVVDLVGEDHVALGSDFDGNVQTPFDSANINQLTHTLLAHRFTEPQIKKIMGENVKRLLLEYLPNEEIN